MTRFKKILTALFAAMLVLTMLPTGAFAGTFTETYSFTVPTAEADGSDEPLITIGTISDTHTDYNLQNTDPYVRKAYITAMDALKAAGVDLVLVGGDMTSDNQDGGDNFRWDIDVYNRTLSQYQKYATAASKTGVSLWACGNHDHEVGRYSNTLDANDYDAYEGFQEIMLATAGYPIDVYTQAMDSTEVTMFGEHWLGAHYNVNGFDFIIINPPYSASTYYSTGTLNWLDTTLEKIGADKTVFITGHYPLYDSRNMTRNDDYGIKDANYTNFMNVMKKYNNAIYLYGHNHGDGDSVYISADSFERITHYDANGAVVNDRTVNPTSFITAFMGSASYYKYSLNPDWLGAADPYIIQAMTITVYSDRIEFKMINCGQREGTEREPAVWTVVREVSCSGSSEDETPILVTEDVNNDVYYGSALGITKFEMPEDTTALTCDGHTIEAEGIKGFSLSVKRIATGTKYTRYFGKLSKVVNSAVIFEYTVKKASRTQEIDTPVKVTVPALVAELGSKTGDIELAAYYWDTDGKLCMTDVQVNEDGSYSFVMTNLSAFALSARANVKDQLSKIKTEKEKEEFDPTIIIIAAAAVVTVAAIAFVVIILVKPPKAAPKKEAEGEAETKEE